MEVQRYLTKIKDNSTRIVETIQKKGNDYGHNNFNRISDFLDLTYKEALFIRMLDKTSRLATYIKKKELMVNDETVIDTLLDLSAYSLIFATMIQLEKEDK